VRGLSIKRCLDEETRKQGVCVNGKVFSMHVHYDEIIITDNEDYSKIYEIVSLEFAAFQEESEECQ